MTLYISREASKLWKRLWAEVTTEIKLLAENWKCLLAGLVFQYIHGLAARSIHYFHRPGPLLQDVGFYLLPLFCAYLGAWPEEILSFFLWTFHPFIFKSKRIYTVLIWCRVLAFLSASQFLRIITFYSTILPGPNYHCREGSERATLPRPDNLIDAFIIVPRGIFYGCGDLIFSSHMIFTLVFVLTYNKYGARRFIKLCSWLIAVAQSLLIVASRKHYTVDVAVAWYTVNLVVFFIDKKLPELPDRTSGAGTLLLPVSTKEKDIRNKEETHKLINGNSGEPNDRRQRTQLNGKSQDDANHIPTHAGNAMNGGLC